MMALTQELFHGHDGAGTGLIDWHNGTGTVAQTQAPFRGTMMHARFNRPGGTGTMALARCMADVVMHIPSRYMLCRQLCQ